MKFSRTATIGIAGLAACALALTGGGLSMYARAAQLTEDNASLFLPSSYEQYLELQSPKDLAIDNGHIAIADGNHIYLCDREKQEWRMYTNGTDSSTFGKIQLVDDLLYFTDASMKLCTLDPKEEELKEEDLSYSLSNFAIVGGKLYGTTTVNTTASLYALDPDGSTSIPQTIPLQTDLPVQLPMTYAEGDLYYAVKNLIFSVDTTTNVQSDFLTLQNNSLISPSAIAVLGDHLFYTDSTGLYCADIVGAGAQRVPEAVVQGEGFSALTVHGDKLYVLCGKAVREFDPGTKAFTDYEISSTSASVNRLCGAVDTARAGGLLVTADAGNKRISVAVLDNSEEGYIVRTCSVFDCLDENHSPYVPTHIATDGNIIAVSSADAHIYLYHFGDESYYYCHNLSGDCILDLACVNGSCYFITQSSYGKAEKDFQIFEHMGSAPKALVADNRGNLYVVDSNGTIMIYNESEFIEPNIIVSREKEFTISDTFSSVQSDDDGNIYYISQDALWKNEKKLVDFNNKSFVYGDQSKPIAFALGHDEGKVFLLYQNYIVALTILSF